MTDSQNEQKNLQQAITAQETLRSTLGDATVDAVIMVLREKLNNLETNQKTEERKLVTVLFADVVGFTAMSEKLDPEDVQTIMRGYFSRWTGILEQHGGRVEKFIGDAVMAVFGFVTAREDDAEQAIRAALEIRKNLEEYNQQLQQKYALHLQVRVGINTGMVLEGLLGPDGKLQESMLVGDTVNVASRLEHASPVDGILISHDTYRHVRGVFDVQEQPLLEIKGKSDPLKAYVVLQAKPRAFRQHTRGVEGVETRMIGREAEFLHLQDAFELVLADSHLQMVTVVGDPGIGKSRLLYEFENWIELRPETIWTFRARASQQSRSNTFALLRDLFNDRFGIFDNDLLADARRKFVQGTAGFIKTDAEEKAHFIGHVLGLDFSDSPYIKDLLSDAAQIRDRALRYITEFFTAAGNIHPAVLYLEDIHWADDSSLDVLLRLGQDCARIPLLILCMARPLLYERRPLWGSGQSFASRLDLDPLSKLSIRKLADEILRKMDEVPQALRELLAANSEGNPFYLEELVKMLIEDGVIVAGPETWRVDPGRLIQVRVPSTLVGVLQARLDGLPPLEKRVLQRAAVAGRVFWDLLVVQIGEENEQSKEDTLQTLTGLTRRELVYLRETSAFAGVQEYIFKHTILHDIAYETVLKKQRKVYHQQAAEWLVEQSGERLDEYANLIAAHYQEAGDIDDAAKYYERAGDVVVKRGLNGEAMPLYRQALDGPVGPNHCRLLLKLGEAALELGDLPVAQSALQQALGLVGKDLQAEAEAQCLLGMLETAYGNYPVALAHLQVALPLARKVSNQRLLVRVLLAITETNYRKGDASNAQPVMDEAIQVAETIKDPVLLMNAFNRQGSIYAALGDTREAARQIQKSLALARQIGHREGEMKALNGLGYLASMSDIPAAIEYFESAVRVARELGNLQGLWNLLSNLAETYISCGKLKQAAPLLSEALFFARQARSQLWLLIIIVTCAYYKLELGDLAGSLRLMGLVLTHPAREADIIEQTRAWLDQKQHELGLSDAEMAAGLAEGNGLDPDAVAAELMAEFSEQGSLP